MHGEVYAAQCSTAEARNAGPVAGSRRALFALALGTFAIGTGEFGSNGIIQLFARGLDASVPTATWAITAYALGVVIGSPAITVAAARVNRRTLLLALMGLFLVGNAASALADGIGSLAVARFLSGCVQGAFFGAGAVVAGFVYGPGRGGKAFATVMAGLTVATIAGAPLSTFVGQNAGWRAMYWTVVGLGVLATVALYLWLPRTSDLRGRPVADELTALRSAGVWAVLAVAALGISSIFAVYTFIGPFITDAAGAHESVIPFALAVFGLGMAAGNALGGRLADRHPDRGLIGGYAATLVLLVVIALAGDALAVLLPALFGVGAAMMLAIPSIQVRLTERARKAPTLVGALNLAALNLANSLGATGGAIMIAAGWGTLSTVWAGFVLTTAGLVLYLAIVTRTRSAPAPALQPARASRT